MFESIALNPPDAIFGLSEEFNRDPNPTKINLTVGMYQDESGQTPIMRCVRKAARQLFDEAQSHVYLPIDGLGSYNRLIPDLILGHRHSAVDAGRVLSAQTPGGTAALRIAGDLLKQVGGVRKIWMSDPSWANHVSIFHGASLEILRYPWLDRSNAALDFGQLMETIAKMDAGDAILLHTVCHNPTGVDPTPEQWRTIFDALERQRLFPIFDFAYQGFGISVDADAQPIREFCDRGHEALICSSFSKNFNLYGERVGAITVVGRSTVNALAVMSQFKSIIRTMYSTPPTHGAAIVAKVLFDDVLRRDWLTELESIRIRIGELREMFVVAIKQRLPEISFEHIRRQRGMFSQSGISGEAADRLKEDHSVYLLRSGRINVAGINATNLDPLCDAIAAVLTNRKSMA